jgi:NADP-dependent 3-hydroxy acid dehydrogenase YdfG
MTAAAPGGPLAGQSAVVTGASRGIGAAIARLLASAGARIAVVARSEEPLRALADELGHGAVAAPCDMRDPEATERTIASLAAALDGGPDIVVNNAGIFLIARAHETPVQTFRDLIEVNLTAPFAFARAFLPVMRQRGRGHLVTIGSIADRSVMPGNTAYTASKYGLRAMHEALRAELRGSGVRASLVSPGHVDTELWDPIDPDNRAGFTPRSRMLAPADVAEAVRWVLTAPNDVNVDELRLSRS